MDDLMDEPGIATLAHGNPPVGSSLEERVPETVADLLRARDDVEMLTSLCALVEACGGQVAVDGRDPVASLRTLPDRIRVAGGREMTLGPVLRALSAAAVERASGDLTPPRRLVQERSGPRDDGEMLVALDLGSVAAVRVEFGEAGARWLVEKLRRTLRSLLGEQDRALRYPAMRFLVLLGTADPGRAHQFARRLAWEWDAYLGRQLGVGTQVEPVEGGDLAASLRRLSFGAAA